MDSEVYRTDQLMVALVMRRAITDVQLQFIADQLDHLPVANVLLEPIKQVLKAVSRDTSFETPPKPRFEDQAKESSTPPPPAPRVPIERS